MNQESGVVDVGVSKQVLRVGSDAYPLRNIVRVGQSQIEPDRWTAFKNFLKVGLAVLVFLIIATLVAENFDTISADVVGLIAIGLWVINAVVLVKRLRQSTLHVLIVETARSSDAVLASPDAERVSDVAQRIVKAVDNPMAEFQMKVKNVHVGDKITQYGDNNIGKQVEEADK